MLALATPVNTEHPLLGKAIISAGIALFGDNSLGWRFFSTVAGAATVVALFAITWQLLGRMRPAVLAGVFAMLNMRSEEHTSELQSLMRISYAVFCLKKKKKKKMN